MKLQPGGRATLLVIWDVDDESKRSDPRYWWSEQVSALPDGQMPSGPKGQTLASLRAEAVGDQVLLHVPYRPGEQPPSPEVVAFPVGRLVAEDDERTRVIVWFVKRPTEDEVAADRAARGGRSLLPAAVEPLRRDWAEALDAGDYERARTLKPQLDEAMAAHGFVKPPLADADADVEEVAPGVFLMDARRAPAAR